MKSAEIYKPCLSKEIRCDKIHLEHMFVFIWEEKMIFDQLSPVQKNVLIASIIGDGEITKRYTRSRRKNHSYREHYGRGQEAYRQWKASFFPDLLYLTPKSQTLRSRSHPLFTELYPYFYDEQGQKRIPLSLLPVCTSPHFLAVLFMDDGSLCISRSINHREKKIYLAPHIYLYLQNYPLEQLNHLQQHIEKQFGFSFLPYRRRDGHGYILRFTATRDTYAFLQFIEPVTRTCPSMLYKTNWPWRLAVESDQLKPQYPDYDVLSSARERRKPYSLQEVEQMIRYKKNGLTDQEIANKLNRTYWSIVYKLRELRESGHL